MKLTLQDLEERVLEKPFFIQWDMPELYGGDHDSIREAGNINYEGLSGAEKMLLYIYAWNMNEFCPTKRSVMQEFGWTAYKVSKLYRELKPYGITCLPLVSEETGLLCGTGYHINMGRGYYFNHLKPMPIAIGAAEPISSIDYPNCIGVLGNDSIPADGQ